MFSIRAAADGVDEHDEGVADGGQCGRTHRKPASTRQFDPLHLYFPADPHYPRNMAVQIHQNCLHSRDR